jgi:hypothetical protein
MQKRNVRIGAIYYVRVGGNMTEVRITRESPNGGWYGTNQATGREIRIRTAARLRSEVPAKGITGAEARRIVNDIAF